MIFNPQLVNSIHGHLERNEIEMLYRYASQVAPGSEIVEIGSYQGRSTVLLAKGAQAASAARVWAVDSFNDQSGFMHTTLDDRAQLLANLTIHGVVGIVEIITGASVEVAAEWGEYFSAHPISLLFIDASHLYKDVKADFEAWSPFVKGFIALHDTTGNYPGVKQFVDELLAAGEWQVIERADSMAVLERVNG